MAILAPMEWDVRSTGNASNGGGFDPVSGTPGTDYSVQDAAQRTWLAAGGTYTNDLAATNAANSVLSSVSYSFAAADVGNVVNVTAGTNFTAGRYQIISVSGGNATLDRNATTGSAASSGSGYEGGGVPDPALVTSYAVAGNVIHIKGGVTFAVASATVNVATGCLKPPAGYTGGNPTRPTRVLGYKTTHYDHPTGADRPLLQATNTIATFSICDGTNASVEFEDIIVDGAGYTSARGFDLSGTYTVARNCKALNCTNYGFNAGRASFCESDTCNSGFYTTQASDCWSHAHTSGGFYASAGITLERIIASGGTGSAVGVTLANGGRCSCAIVYGNASHGVYVNSGSARMCIVENVIAEGNGGTGLAFAANNNYIALLVGCFTYNNGTAVTASLGTDRSRDRTGAALAPIALSASPFVNAGSNDFRLNNRAGAGASVRAKGYPSAFPGLATLLNYRDVGAVQHRELMKVS